MKKSTCTLLLVALCTGILSVAALSAYAAEFREKGSAFIDRKGPNALQFDGHTFSRFADSYMAVTFRTHFYDENGEQIDFADLKIPCRARIEYRESAADSVPEAISVEVEYYRQGRPLETQWNLPVMKPKGPQ